MSRFKRLEDVIERLPDLSAEELRTELEFWKTRSHHMYGRAVKPYLKWIHKLESALEIAEGNEFSE